jgi:hypothetical protein
MPDLRYFWRGNFWTSSSKIMAGPKTSHTAACDPLAPQPSQPTPSPRLRQCRVRLVSMKSSGKCPICNTFGQAISDEFFQDGPFAKSSPLQSCPPSFASANTFDNYVSSLPFICSKYVIALSRPTSPAFFVSPSLYQPSSLTNCVCLLHSLHS